MKRTYVAAITRRRSGDRGQDRMSAGTLRAAVKMKGLTGVFPRQITAVAHKANRLTFVSICNDF